MGGGERGRVGLWEGVGEVVGVERQMEGGGGESEGEVLGRGWQKGYW